ncbi:MAG: hypothetical protein JW818_15500 [Pirellulales bacterium]|nr:hypothetical protein [Pirellulales bacterium]
MRTRIQRWRVRLSVLAGVVLFVFAAMTLSRWEEDQLLGRYGEAYGTYARATPRFFPALAKLAEPATYVVHSRILRQHLVDAMIFLCCVGLLEFSEELRDLGWIPTLFRTY